MGQASASFARSSAYHRQQAEQQRQAELERQRQHAEQQRQAELQRQRQQAEQQRLIEQQRQAALARQQQAAAAQQQKLSDERKKQLARTGVDVGIAVAGETAIKGVGSAATRATGKVLGNPVIGIAEQFLDPENASDMYKAVDAAKRQQKYGTINKNAARQLEQLMKD
jgi:hypothetical protein